MSDKGGLLLISNSSNPPDMINTEALIKKQQQHHHKKHHQKPSPTLDAAVLDRLANMKISDANNNEKKMDTRKSSNSDESANSTMSFTSSSSGIGSGELSPILNDSKSACVSIEEKSIVVGQEGGKIQSSQRRGSVGTEKSDQSEDRDEKHTRSFTIASSHKKPMDPKKIVRPNQQGGHLSPAEFFQMSRLRASALANKLNTSATYGGSKDLVTTGNLTSGQQLKKEENVDSAVDELAKAVEGVKLEKKEDGKEDGKKLEVGTGDGDLIGRSPVPVHTNNRHVQHPYRSSGVKYPTPQSVPIPGYCTPKGPDGSPITPADYLNQQRRQAYPGQHGHQYMMAQTNNYQMYPQQPTMMEERQNQITPPSCFQPSQAHIDQAMCSPGYEYGNQNSPCAIQQQQRCSTNSTPPAGTIVHWGQNQDSVNMGYVPAPGNCSPMSAVSADDGHGNYQMVFSPFEETGLINGDRTANLTEELNRFFEGQKQKSGTNERHMANKNVDELPEALSDFILKYSRRYSTSSSTTQSSGHGGDGMSSGCVSGEPSPISVGHRRASDSSLSGGSGDESGVEDDHMSSISGRSLNSARPDSCQSAVFIDSPQSGGTVYMPPTASPAGQVTKLEEKSSCKFRPLRPKQQPAQPQQAAQPIIDNQSQPASPGKARQRLREMIPQHEFDSAWAWAMRCCQACPGSLMFRDVDGDSLLHIVVWHKDLAKIYAITEILMKDDQPVATKPIDMPNKLDETPLFLAVEKRSADVVTYLLECGANPNLRARNHDGDGPLHYAAARGMSEIIQLFNTSTKTNFNLLNGSGMTPLLCAVKNHGVIEEESQCLVNNKPTIRILLKAGADPKIPDVASGKSVLHYCVERMDPDLVELFRDHLTKDAMSQLVNMPDYNGDTPLSILSRVVGESPKSASQFARAEGEEELRRKMLNTLIDCGADVSQCAGGLGDNGNGNGGYTVLYPEQDNTDDIQFTILDSELTQGTY